MMFGTNNLYVFAYSFAAIISFNHDFFLLSLLSSFLFCQSVICQQQHWWITSYNSQHCLNTDDVSRLLLRYSSVTGLLTASLAYFLAISTKVQDFSAVCENIHKKFAFMQTHSSFCPLVIFPLVGLISFKSYLYQPTESSVCKNFPAHLGWTTVE